MSEQALVTITAPSFLAAYAAQNPAFAAVNADAMAGLSAGMPPTITLNGTRFLAKINGEDINHDQLTLDCIILKAKPGIEKSWYGSKFVPGQDTQPPDCYSLNGVAPEPDSPNPQCANCAGCAQNQFGSALDNAGNAMKGKACSDSKSVAMWVGYGLKSIFRFKIPPASLQNFAKYVNDLKSHNLYLPAVITTISFVPTSSFPQLQFKANGALNEQQFAAIVAKIESPEAEQAINFKISAAPKQVTNAPVTQAQTAPVQPVTASVVVDAMADLGIGAATTAPVDTAAETATKVAKAAAAKAAKEAKAAAAAAAAPPIVVEATPVVAADPLDALGSIGAGPSADDLSAALGL